MNYSLYKNAARDWRHGRRFCCVRDSMYNLYPNHRIGFRISSKQFFASYVSLDERRRNKRCHIEQGDGWHTGTAQCISAEQGSCLLCAIQFFIFIHPIFEKLYNKNIWYDLFYIITHYKILSEFPLNDLAVLIFITNI